MLSREYRLAKNQDFTKIIAEGKKISTKKYSLYYLDGPKLQFGITVSTKVGNAIVRNKIRRQIHSHLQELLKRKAFASLQIVIIVRKEYLDFEYQQNMVELETILNKIEVKHEE